MRAARALLELRRWGATLAGGYASAAARSPDAIALVDERGALTFGEVNERAELIARALVADGIEPLDAVHPATMELYRTLSRRGTFS